MNINPHKLPRPGYQIEFVSFNDKAKTESSPCFSNGDLFSSTDKSWRKLPTQVKKLWRKAAIWVTVFCIIVSFLLAVSSLVTAKKSRSSSILAMAFDTILAFIGSCSVLWRFQDDDKNAEEGRKKERISFALFGGCFILSGAITITASIGRLLEHTAPKRSLAVLVILVTACATYFALAATQWHISRKLQSSAMMGSCLDSLISAMLIFGMLLSDVIYNYVFPWLWYLDHIVALGISLISIICGIKIVIEIFVYDKLPIEEDE